MKQEIFLHHMGIIIYIVFVMPEYMLASHPRASFIHLLLFIWFHHIALVDWFLAILPPFAMLLSFVTLPPFAMLQPFATLQPLQHYSLLQHYSPLVQSSI